MLGAITHNLFSKAMRLIMMKITVYARVIPTSVYDTKLFKF